MFRLKFSHYKKILIIKEEDNFMSEVYMDVFFDYELESNNNSETDNDVSVSFKRRNARIIRSSKDSDNFTDT